MESVEPSVFLIGETRVHGPGVGQLLQHLGAPDWTTDAKSDVEVIPEIMGRLCYKSFAPGLNPNVTRVRKGSAKYLGHVIDVGHGSVLEHSTVNFVFCDVSRVFTHELVRHRAGTAMSQESLRFVRLDDLKAWMPPCISEDMDAMKIAYDVFQVCEEAQKRLAELYDLDSIKFEDKKKLTSAMRRLAPIGLATNIGWSANVRAIRHVLEMRTHPSAEVEIRLVFAEVGRICKERYPNAFQDYEVEEVDGLPWFKTSSRKV